MQFHFIVSIDFFIIIVIEFKTENFSLFYQKILENSAIRRPKLFLKLAQPNNLIEILLVSRRGFLYFLRFFFRVFIQKFAVVFFLNRFLIIKIAEQHL